MTWTRRFRAPDLRNPSLPALHGARKETGRPMNPTENFKLKALKTDPSGRNPSSELSGCPGNSQSLEKPPTAPKPESPDRQGRILHSTWSLQNCPLPKGPALEPGYQSDHEHHGPWLIIIIIIIMIMIMVFLM